MGAEKGFSSISVLALVMGLLLASATFIGSSTVSSHSLLVIVESDNASSPDWPMFRHNPQRTGYTVEAGPTSNNLLWSYTTGDWVRSSPAVAGDRVYVGSDDNKIYCLNADTGAFIWSYTTGCWVFSSPAVAEGRVYVGSCDNKVYCFNAENGALIWSYTTGGRVDSSPAVVNGRVYIGSNDSNVYCFGIIYDTKDATFYSSVSDDYIHSGFSFSYSNARDAASGLSSYSSEIACIGQDRAWDEYDIYRAFVFFNTSSIPDSATITSARLSLYGAAEGNVADWRIVVQSGMPDYPHDRLVLTDYNRTYYDGDGGSLDASMWSTTGYNDIFLNATGLGWVNKTGWTKFCLRSSDDKNNIPPENSSDDTVSYYMSEKGQIYRPKLVVHYYVPDNANNPPYVPSNPSPSDGAMNIPIGGDLGCLRNLSWSGGDPDGNPVTYHVYLGTSYPPPSYGSTSSTSYPVSGLSVNTTYYWWVVANDGQEDSSGLVWTFTTAPKKAEFKLENLYKVSLDTNLWFENGSKLVVKFYDYLNNFESENVFWSGTTPAHVEKFENIPHPPQGSLPVRNAVKRADLVLTTDNTENVISTIASFTVYKSDLRYRYIDILAAWSANPGLQGAFRAEIQDILGLWPAAPP